MDHINDAEKEIIKNWFQETEYHDLETASKNKDILVLKMLFFSENEGKDSIDILLRRITHVKYEGKKSTVKYKFTVSRHESGSIDNLKFFDSSLITYYINGLKGRKPEIRHIAGASALGKHVKYYTEDEINKIYDELMKQGRNVDAKSYLTTWQIAQRNDKLERIYR